MYAKLVSPRPERKRFIKSIIWDIKLSFIGRKSLFGPTMFDYSTALNIWCMQVASVEPKVYIYTHSHQLRNSPIIHVILSNQGKGVYCNLLENEKRTVYNSSIN